MRPALIDHATGAFRNIFGQEPRYCSSAPGRVNLIGEHTDYNDGFVLPMAIDRSICMVGTPRDDGLVVIHSADLNETVQIDLADASHNPHHPWSDYIVGVALWLRRLKPSAGGAEIVVRGDIPLGAGLSSSAALEVAAAFLLRIMYDLRIGNSALAQLCQQVENEFVGVRCGIMDQFVSTSAQKNHALLIDCRSLETRHIRLPESVAALVCDTGVKRKLASSEYNLRRSQCEEGTTYLSRYLPDVTALRDVSPETFDRYKAHIPEPARSRCHHVVSENDRVLKAVAALDKNDLPTFGKLLYESHMSLKNDYDVSCPELDAVVDICAEADGVYGGRMTGAGFGGSAICIVEREHLSALEARIRTEYPRFTGRNPGILVTGAEAGATGEKMTT
jgi:galactokinase